MEISKRKMFPCTVTVGGVSVELRSDGSWVGDRDAFVAALKDVDESHAPMIAPLVWLIANAMRTEWQPIETAPRDGTSVLLFDPEADHDYDLDRDVPRIAVGSYKGLPDGYHVWKGYYSGTNPVNKPTHWMPLPEPPK